MKLKRVTSGYYETSAGHCIEKHGAGPGAFWAITWPGQKLPDVSRPSLRQAFEYVQMFPEGDA